MTIRVCEAMNAPVGRLSDRTVCEANGGVLPRQVLIDADGCPVVDLTLQIARQFGVPVIILCDTSHQIEREGAQTLVFDINEAGSGVAGAQRYQHHQQYLYPFGFFQQGVLCQCHRQHFPGEHKGVTCNKNKAARNLKKVRTAYLVPMVGLEPTRHL